MTKRFKFVIAITLILSIIFTASCDYAYNVMTIGDCNITCHIKNGKIYDKNNKLVKNKIVKVNSSKYYANKNGTVVKNKIFKYSNNKYYYAQTKGTIATSKMFTYSGKKYYSLSDGSLASGRMIDYKGNRYYASKNRNIVTKKLFTYKNKMFYAQNKGALAKGKMVTYNGKKYYAGNKYELVKNKKVLIKGNYYYFGNDGILVINKTVTIDGVKYKSDSEGKLTKVKNTTTSTTTQTTTQAQTTDDKKPSKTACSHKWVVDEKAHYEWYNLYDENGCIITNHQLCPGCGYDLTEYAKKINNDDLLTLLKTHPCIAGNVHISCAEFYNHYGKDENGNWIDHPHKGQSVGMDTYIPATYKCSECGAKVYMNPINNNLNINIHKLQKDGKDTDITKLTWIYEGTNYDGEGKKEVSIKINGKTLKCSSFYDMN